MACPSGQEDRERYRPDVPCAARRTLLAGLIFALVVACSGLPALPAAIEDAGACAAAQAGTRAPCDPHAPDPLAEPACADALRVVVRACAGGR